MAITKDQERCLAKSFPLLILTAMTKREQITEKAKQLLGQNPGGLRFKELVAALREFFPGAAYGNFTGAIWNLDDQHPEEIYKPGRGLFRLTRFRTQGPVPPSQESTVIQESSKDATSSQIPP